MIRHQRMLLTCTWRLLTINNLGQKIGHTKPATDLTKRQGEASAFFWILWQASFQQAASTWQTWQQQWASSCWHISIPGLRPSPLDAPGESRSSQKFPSLALHELLILFPGLCCSFRVELVSDVRVSVELWSMHRSL